MRTVWHRPFLAVIGVSLFGMLMSPLSASAKGSGVIAVSPSRATSTASMKPDASSSSSQAISDVQLLNSSPITLYENLRMGGAKWKVQQEVHFVHHVSLSWLHLFQPQSQVELFVNPKAPFQKFYIAVIKNSNGKPVAYMINRKIFFSLGSFRRSIHDPSDWEMIGRTLGLYSGTISVPLGT